MAARCTFRHERTRCLGGLPNGLRQGLDHIPIFPWSVSRALRRRRYSTFFWAHTGQGDAVTVGWRTRLQRRALRCEPMPQRRRAPPDARAKAPTALLLKPAAMCGLAKSEIPEHDRAAAAPAPASTAAASAASASATTTSGFCRRRASSHGDCGHANGSKKINDNHGCRRQSAHELAAYAA